MKKQLCVLCAYAGVETEATTSGKMINPENEQKANESALCDDCASDNEAEMALTVTGQYHDWHNTITDRLYDACREAEEQSEIDEAIAEYRAKAKKLTHSSYDIDTMVDDNIALAVEGAAINQQ